MILYTQLIPVLSYKQTKLKIICTPLKSLLNISRQINFNVTKIKIRRRNIKIIQQCESKSMYT